jgi:pimeloyl-ACP methyl ester carboxylesterase
MPFYPNHKTLTLQDGATIAYAVLGEEHLGEKLPLVLINGLSARMGDWIRLTDELMKRRPVLIFDNRGLGDSKFVTPDDIVSIDSMANDTIELITSFGWNVVDICGHSMGGVILQQILLTRNLPFKIHRALLTSTTTKWPKSVPEFVQIVKTTAPRTEEEKARLVRQTVEVNFDKGWVEDGRNEETLRRWIERAGKGRPAGTIQKQAIALYTKDTRADLPNIAKLNPSTKILILHGTIDSVVHSSEGVILRELLPHATVLEVGEGPRKVPSLEFGHLWWEYFDVEIWVRVVEGFLDGAGIDTRL